MKPHPHAELMKQYAEDAALDGECWRNWQSRGNDEEAWRTLEDSPSWYTKGQYRRRPRVIVINGIEVPEPLREAPEDGFRYWFPRFGLSGWSDWLPWDGITDDRRMLEAGLIHTTREAAELHAKALLSFTAQQPCPPTS